MDSQKYETLRQEYSKVKAQNTLLRKALKDEQTSSQTLQIELKSKEEEIKKSVQQLDSLSFHNVNLTKRIQQMQTLVKENKTNSSSSSSSSPSSSTSSSSSSWFGGGNHALKKDLEKTKAVLETLKLDLQIKIEENEKLHQQLHETIQSQDDTIAELKRHITISDEKLTALQCEMMNVNLAHEEDVAALKREINRLNEDVSITKDQLISSQAEKINLEISHKSETDLLLSDIKLIIHSLDIFFASDKSREESLIPSAAQTIGLFQENAWSAISSHIKNRVLPTWRQLQQSIEIFHERLEIRIGGFLQISESDELNPIFTGLLHEASSHKSLLTSLNERINKPLSTFQIEGEETFNTIFKSPITTPIAVIFLKITNYYENLFDLLAKRFFNPTFLFSPTAIK